MNVQTHPKVARAFTLVEVLVVLAILSVLAALVIPMINRAMVSAKSSACASNMRQIGVAMMTYASDYGGELPETSHSGDASLSWIYTLSRYLGDMDEIRICPADPRREALLAGNGTSYVLNSYLFLQRYDRYGDAIGPKPNHLLRIAHPSRTILAFIGSEDGSVGVGSDHTHSEQWTSWGALLADIEPDRHRVGDRGADRSIGSANYLYADGHVENFAASTIRAEILQGINIADPPED